MGGDVNVSVDIVLGSSFDDALGTLDVNVLEGVVPGQLFSPMLGIDQSEARYYTL